MSGEDRTVPPEGPDETPPPSDVATPDAGRGFGQTLSFRLVQWTKIFSAYFSAQSVAQLLGIGAGILFIRYLPKEEFALYTLAFSVVSFFHFVTDLGSTSSLVHFRRKALTQGEDFAAYEAAVLSLRRSIFLLGSVAVVVAFPFLAIVKGFPALDAMLAGCAIAAAVWFQLVSSIRLLTLRLHDRYGRSYRAELLGGAVRLGLAAVIVVSSLLRAWLGVLAGAVASAVVAWAARDPQREGSPVSDLTPYRKRVVRYLLPTLPSALYFSIQGPLVVWLAATFGDSTNIAEVGALGRLGLVVGLFSGLTSVVFVPRLALVTDPRHYRLRYFQYGAFMALLAGALLGAAALAPDAFLFVLGPHYAGLYRELLLTVAGSGLTLLGGYAVAINFARSWNRWQGAAAGLLFLGQVAFVMLVPLGSTAGVLTFNALTAALGLVLQLTINLLGFARPRWVAWS